MSKIKYIDIHSHVNFKDFDQDREQVIGVAQAEGVAMINVGTDYETSKECIELSHKHPDMWAAVGVHPTEVGRPNSFAFSGEGDPASFGPLQKLVELAKNEKVVAIGECGLDYFHSKPEEVPVQRKIFKDHIALANALGKPLMLHVRNGKDAGPSRNAYKDAVAILKNSAKVRANFHFFAGTIEDAKSILDNGGMLSFTGVLTFTPDYDALVKYVPFDRIMSETDCPFATPAPHRGKKNQPVYVIEVVKAITRIKGANEEATRAQLLENARSFFNLKP